MSHVCTTPSTSSASGLNPTSAPPTSASATPVSPAPQSPIPPLLQDPNLLRQLLPALQATLQLNNSNVDISKINEGNFLLLFGGGGWWIFLGPNLQRMKVPKLGVESELQLPAYATATYTTVHSNAGSLTH